jgi:hypothetical protein
LHSFYPIAFALLLLAVFADAWNEWKGWQPALGRHWRRQMLMALALCLVAINLTPFGWHSVKQVIVNIAHSDAPSCRLPLGGLAAFVGGDGGVVAEADGCAGVSLGCVPDR